MPDHRILVVIDPTAQSHPSLERAARLAKRLPASLELFICDYDPHMAASRFVDPKSVANARSTLMANHARRLRDLAWPLAEDDIDVTVDARWDYPLHEGIVRKADESNATFVVKDTHYHSVLRRSIFSNTDWNVIRACPASLLLVKPRAAALKPCIVAAIDPLHERDKPAELDNKILSTAAELATALGGELHAFHGFDIAPAIAVSASSMSMPIAMPMRELTDSMRAEHSDAVHALTDARGIARERVHIHQGGTRELLVALTEKLRADIVVMGAVSRTGIKRLFLGNTAEDVLDQLPCDLVIVKPAGFAPPLPF
jgi:universal stress protein E